MKIILSVVALLLGLVGFQYLAPREVSFGLFSADNGKANLEYAATFAATIGGVVIGSFYRALKALKDAGTRKLPRRFFADQFRSVDMWLGLFSSPIVYALILKASDGMSLPALIILALENGFCALIIIDGFTSKQESRRGADDSGPERAG